MLKTHSPSAPQSALQAVSSGDDAIPNQGAHEMDSAGPRVSAHPPECDKPNLLHSWVLGNPQMAITGIPPSGTECRFLLVGSFPAPNAVKEFKIGGYHTPSLIDDSCPLWFLRSSKKIEF
jgi:hypothetical protein